jgi:hypothetical protein
MITKAIDFILTAIVLVGDALAVTPRRTRG